MEASSITWLSEMGMEDPSFIHQCEVSFLTSKQMVDSLLGEEFQHSLTTDSFFSYPPFNPRSSKTTTITTTNYEKLTKQFKTESWNSCTTQLISTPESSSPPNILSFDNPNSTNLQQFYENVIGAVRPKKKAVSDGNMASSPFDIRNCQGFYSNQNNNNKENKSASTLATKSTSCTRDHIMGERKRREKHNQMFKALSAIVPGIKKMDKISVLEDAITYMKQLQERVKILEEQTTKKSMESMINIKKSQLFADDETTSSSDEVFNDRYDELLPQMEVRVSNKNLLIRIHCDFEKHKGILLKIHAKIEKLHLTVVNSCVMPFGNSALEITVVAQMDVEFCMTVKDLVKNLQSEFRGFMMCEKEELIEPQLSSVGCLEELK